MGLADRQRLLARLYTDDDLRTRFFADPDGIGTQYGCGPDDIRALARLPQAQVTFFAQSLRAKRLGEVRKLLPLTCHILGPRTSPLFQRYADTPLPAGLRKHRGDALAFAAFLLRVLPGEADSQPQWLLDLLRYEAGWLKTDDPECCRHAVWLQYAILPLVRSLTDGEPPVVIRSPTLIVWWRVRRHGPRHHWLFALRKA
jgi:hypothetical protein